LNTNHRITLYYFDARGRAQFLRHYLLVRGFEFDDHRIPLSADYSEWLAVRDDRTVTGPFKRLPVLKLDEQQVGETVVIANFLHDRLGDAATLSETANLRHAMLLSSVYGDLMMALGTLIWADRMYPGMDLQGHLKISTRRLKQYLQVLDETLNSWEWTERIERNPLVGDCLLWDQLDLFCVLLGDFIPLSDFESLAQFYSECPARTRFQQFIAANPCPFTGHPDEPEAIEAIQQTLRTMQAEGAL
jgi:glutathione S-transferase